MGLLSIIKRNNDVRKLFGERELKIVEKQLLGVRLKASERTRLSRDIRKKFNVIKVLAEYSDEFDLKYGADIKKMIEEAKEVILESRWFPKIRKIILFGSIINNQLTLYSDIDIAVEFKEITIKEATKFRIEIMGRLNEKSDIQVYNVLPDKIKKEINEDGKILYEKN
jgi:predicted nucleotidyltransferase